MVRVPAFGQLERQPLARLLMDLDRQKYSGRLSLKHDRCEKGFVFDRGGPIFAESNLPSESLGVQLMDAGKITRSDYSRVVELVERKQCKEGNALLELGLIEPRELFFALKDQLRTRLVECFGWPRGDYSMDPDERPPEQAHPFRTDVYALVQEGIATHWSSDHVYGELEAQMTLYPKRTRHFAAMQARLRSDATVEAMIERFDGTRTLWQALHGATPRALAAAWVLTVAEALEFRASPSNETGASPAVEVEVVATDADEAGGETVVEPQAEPVREAPTPDIRFEFESEIVDKFSRLAELDHYALLGVKPSDDPAVIRTAYLRAAKTYHPDALARARMDATLRRQAEKVFAAIGKAHAVLSKPQLRRAYDASLGSDDSDADRIANAETLYRKGEVLLRKGNFKGALEFLGPAVELWPEEAAYLSALGWALYKKMPSEPEAAKERLEVAIGLEPDSAIVVFRLSVVMRALGDSVAAATLLERARQLDPKIS